LRGGEESNIFGKHTTQTRTEKGRKRQENRSGLKEIKRVRTGLGFLFFKFEYIRILSSSSSERYIRSLIGRHARLVK
jgi:hypothetical protein